MKCNKMTIIYLLFTAGAVALCVAVPGKAFAGSPEQSYDAMITKLKSFKSYQVTIDDTTVLQPSASGAKARTIKSTDQISFEKPNLFCLRNDGLMGGVSVVCNGKVEFFYSDLTDEYAVRDAPKDVSGSFTGALQGKKVTWTGESDSVIRGLAVAELTGSVYGPRGNTLVNLYISKANSLPVEVQVVLPKYSSANGDGLQVTRTETFVDQKLNEPVPDSKFEFSPPDGSTKVDSLSELAGGFGGGGQGFN